MLLKKMPFVFYFLIINDSAIFRKLEQTDTQACFILNEQIFKGNTQLHLLICFPFYFREDLNKIHFSNELLLLKRNREKCNLANEPERQQCEELSPVKTERHYLKK